MADYRAITGVCKAVVELLRSDYNENYDELNEILNNDLTFEVYLAKDFLQPMAAGVSLFLYQVRPNGGHRTPSGRIGPGGQRLRPHLPVDLHFFLTAWGKDASLQHMIAGWMMRTLEDSPILSAGLLNALATDVFGPDETLEIVLAELTNEELVRMWQALLETGYQLSVPYIARNVRIESTRQLAPAKPVLKRVIDYALVNDKTSL